MLRHMAGKAEGWFRRLTNGADIEVFLKTDTHKIRASGPESDIFEFVDLYERVTGTQVEADWRRVRRDPRPMAGQLSMSELSLDATVEGDDGELP